MAGPEILIDIDKVRSKTRAIVTFCRERGVLVTGVTKVTCGMPLVARAMLEGGVVSLGESRVENIRRMRASGINAPMIMLRIPPLSQVDEIVAHADISLNSELSVIRSLSKAALRKGKIHKIILMVDLGDLREGIWPRDLMDTAAEVMRFKGIRIAGIGTNLTCFGGVLPTKTNMEQLVGFAEEIEETFQITLEIISGGNSSSLPLLASGKMPQRINHLRIGEAIVLGRETVNGTIWPGCSCDAFQLSAELIELKKKPSVPIGETGLDAFGGKPVFTEKGEILRGILSVGREDILVDKLIPEDTNITILGASSDHLLVDVSLTKSPVKLGDQICFNMNYGALLAAMTSNYVRKTPLNKGGTEMEKKPIVMLGNSPLFLNENLLKHLEDLGYKYEVNKSDINEKLILEIVEHSKRPFIGGEINKTYDSIKGLTHFFRQTGLIILSPYASLHRENIGNNKFSFLSKIFGLLDSESDLSSFVSPENTVIIGLREADKSEVEIIRNIGIQAYTMEDIDLLGMREIMINSLRKITTGTEGFYARLSTDVINAEGEGLTFREAHMAMEMIADSTRMLALDISGIPDKSWIDDRALSSIVESAFGRRILRL
ncbi:alanine racemase [Oceanispirochaeta sp.]|jgi:predicted amino acid racemase/arginase family enzyme|uniref:alanine racemase n=1 Tax=Oceanispirochaeta sp. TaxID=2035350 RepID=UPI00260D7F10|nr:alanine racemase [Oceanispirochaeta sp.]MDA3957857.1 alanine racemase [Oceanispirochaeta sp.]